MCPSFNWIFYERDKNAAHKDSNYIVNLSYTSDEMEKKMKQAVTDVQNICAKIISPKISVCYYEYDPLLFRYIHGITPDVEKRFNEAIYYHENYSVKGRSLRAISDARQTRTLTDIANYCVIGKNGLMGQPYDMLQCRQNLCVLLNATYGTDMWVDLRDGAAEKDESLNLIREVLNEYENHTH